MEFQEYLVFWGLNIILELGVARVFLGQAFFDRRLILLVVSLNTITHPVAWQSFFSGGSWLVIEGMVFVIEAVILSLFYVKQAWRYFLLGLLMNLASAFIGAIL